MKKLAKIVASAAIALSFNAGAISIAAAEDGASDTAEACRYYTDAGYFESVGQCVTYFRNYYNDWCKEIGHLYYGNVGQCISAWRAYDNQ